MATMTLLERLKVAEAAGVKAGRDGKPEDDNPYALNDSDGIVWAAGHAEGKKQREYDEIMRKRREEAISRRARLELKLMELLGDELAEELITYIKEITEGARR